MRSSLGSGRDLTFTQWATTLADDATLTATLRDRLLHHVHIVQITGESYRLKDRKKAGHLKVSSGAYAAPALLCRYGLRPARQSSADQARRVVHCYFGADDSGVVYFYFGVDSGDQMTAHGFRSMASTLLNEQGWRRDAIERHLAHGERNEVRAAYNCAEYVIGGVGRLSRRAAGRCERRRSEPNG